MEPEVVDEVVEAVEAAPPAAPDTLREALSQAYDQSATPATFPPEKPLSAAPLAQDPAALPAPPPEDPAAPALERPIPERLKAAFGEKWATLPPEIKKEFHEYESSIGRLASKYGTDAKAWQQTQVAFAPYEQMVKEEGGNFHTAMTNLFETARILRKGTNEQKQALIQQVCQTFKVPFPGGATAEGAPPATAALPPEFVSRIDRIEHDLLTRQATEQQNLRTKVDSELQTFLADDKHVYVKEPGFLETMASLISAGKAEGLPDAYSQAAWLHEGPRTAEIAKINAAKTASLRTQATRAKAAAVSVNGNAPGSVKRDPSKMTLRDTLSAAFDGELDS